MLENAGVKLTEAITVLDGVRRRLSTLDYDQLGLLHAEVGQLWKNEDRIVVRLGRRAPETQCYRRSIDRIDEALITCGDGLAEGFSERDFEGITAARNAAYQAQRQFYDAASRRVGPGETETKVGRWRIRGLRGRSTAARETRSG